jgi:hypothetical protein
MEIDNDIWGYLNSPENGYTMCNSVIDYILDVNQYWVINFTSDGYCYYSIPLINTLKNNFSYSVEELIGSITRYVEHVFERPVLKITKYPTGFGELINC